MKLGTCSITLVVAIAAHPACARIFKIEVDKPKSGQPNIANFLPDSDTLGRFDSWGSSGLDTGNFRNLTGSRIYGMHLKCIDSHHTFARDSTGGQLFRQVWRKTDGSELILRDSEQGVAAGARFWMKVPKTDDLPVRNIFKGQVFSMQGQPAEPTGSDWEKIWQAPDDNPLQQVGSKMCTCSNCQTGCLRPCCVQRHFARRPCCCH